MSKWTGFSLWFCCVIVCAASPRHTNALLPLHLLHLPTGFRISVYAHVPGARSLTLGRQGVVFVGSRGAGRVYRLLPNAALTQARAVQVIAQGLRSPNGVAYDRGHLYVAEVSRVWRFDGVDGVKINAIKKKVIRNDLPTNAHHGWRYIGISPKKKLYVAIGAPCNICESKDKRFNTLVRMDLDGSHFSIYATGIRNSVGFDWNPRDGSLWFTDNGRDWLGDNLPPCELNRADKPGLFFGYPYFYGNGTVDPAYAQRVRASSALQHLAKTKVKPQILFPAHVAPLGMRFYTGHRFRAAYRHCIFVALHGSWNRSQKIGYQVDRVEIKNGQAVKVLPFITGWLHHGRVWGRPVDVLVMPDGALLVSDDYAGVVYRVSDTEHLN